MSDERLFAQAFRSEQDDVMLEAALGATDAEFLPLSDLILSMRKALVDVFSWPPRLPREERETW